MNKFHKDNIAYIRAGVAGIYIACLIAFACFPKTLHTPAIKASEIEPLVTPTITPSPRSCYDNIDKIRCIGEDLGYDGKVISTMIRIARAESNFRSNAKNPTSTASGIFQIIYGTWNSNDCQGSAFNAEDNIRCAYKLYANRGFQPWASSSSKWL